MASAHSPTWSLCWHELLEDATGPPKLVQSARMQLWAAFQVFVQMEGVKIPPGFSLCFLSLAVILRRLGLCLVPETEIVI